MPNPSPRIRLNLSQALASNAIDAALNPHRTEEIKEQVEECEWIEACRIVNGEREFYLKAVPRARGINTYSFHG